LGVLPPEIDSDRQSEECGYCRGIEGGGYMSISEQFVDQARQISPSRYATDRSGKDIVKHERRDGNFGQSSAQRFFDRSIYATPNKHAAALDVNQRHRAAEN